jgi:colicin import membrane protein
MTSQNVARNALMPSRPSGTGRGVGLSLLVHAGLIVAIAFGVSWRSRTPEAQQAELWAAVPQAAAPRAVEPEPIVQPKPVPPPVAKAPPRVEPPPQPAPAPAPDAQIAIEKARVEKARKEQVAAARELERKRLEAEKLREQQAEALKKKLAEERLAQQREAEKQRQLKEAEALKKKQAAEERQAQQLEADRKKNLERMLGQAGASGDARATGSALRSAGPSSSYAGRIVARIRPNIVFADQVAGNPSAEVEVRAAADGTILGRKLVKSSGVAAWDSAVLRAIDKTEMLPRDVDGSVPASLLLVFRVRD